MGLPRDRTVPPNTIGYYHCISRCVRRAWLCGYDKVNDINYDYRRKWVEDRILLLAEAFAVSTYAYDLPGDSRTAYFLGMASRC